MANQTFRCLTAHVICSVECPGFHIQMDGILCKTSFSERSSLHTPLRTWSPVHAHGLMVFSRDFFGPHCRKETSQVLHSKDAILHPSSSSLSARSYLAPGLSPRTHVKRSHRYPAGKTRGLPFKRCRCCSNSSSMARNHSSFRTYLYDLIYIYRFYTVNFNHMIHMYKHKLKHSLWTRLFCNFIASTGTIHSHQIIRYA